MSLTQRVEVETTAQARRGLPPWVAFGICAGLLVMTFSAIVALQTTLNVYLEKDPIPLHKSLDRLDKAELAPYQFVQSLPLSDEVVEALGTKDYIQWVLDDPRRGPSDPLRHPILFITYYTGGRSRVPHTPERCFLGANFELANSWTSHFTVPDVDAAAPPKDVTVKNLMFTKAGLLGNTNHTVVYTFYANCDYACEGEYIRMAVNKLGIPKSFFSKVEISFAGGRDGSPGADPQKAAKAAEDLMRVVLPVLMREHWPRVEELTATKAPAEQ